MKPFKKKAVALVATNDRWKLLINKSLTSIKQQIISPEKIIIINDGKEFNIKQTELITKLLNPIQTMILNNSRAKGLAGAYNTGLYYLINEKYDGFVALLDDDDKWDSNHLMENLNTALKSDANIVISGLRYYKNGVDGNRPLIQNITDRDFIVGNPGWQGSNTFVHISILKEVGCFREGLLSMNDRDLAIRLIRSKNSKIAFTNKWTATWYFDTRASYLSQPVSIEKLQGLRMFWKIYQKDMNDLEKEKYFQRAIKLFGITKDMILMIEDK